MESTNLDESHPSSLEPINEISQQAGENPASADSASSPVAEQNNAQPLDETHDIPPVEASSEANQPGQMERPLSDTQPSEGLEDGIVIPPDIPDSPPAKSRGRYRWILWAVFAVLLLALIAGGSVYAGYNTAIGERVRNESTAISGEAANQYVLAQQDIALGNYDRARQRLEYIIKLDPNYPGVSEQLAFVLTEQRITATPTLAPTPTLTPTPDFRTRDELFAQAQNLLVGHEWTKTIDTLLQLRKNFPDFMAVKVDDMLFVALRNRGIDKIAQLHDLEGGNYDLSLAEKFGPLDTEARNWRDWAELYIRGASFWDVDWGQSVYYFSQLASAAPNLSDISGWTATNRYLDALLGYGDWYAARSQWCDAQAQYDMYMSLLANSQVEPTAMFAADQCAQGVGPTGTPGNETPLPGTAVPTETPSGPTSTPFMVPTETQRPGATHNPNPTSTQGTYP